MIFSTYEKFVEFILNQPPISWFTVVNYNNKTQNDREVSYFQLPKDTSVHKDWIHATNRQVDNLPSKLFLCSDHFEEKCFDPSCKLQMNCTM